MEDHKTSDFMDDLWFFESVRRYNTIQMFDLQNTPDHVLQLDDSTLCVASRHSEFDYMELLKLKLPAKLTVPAEEEGRIKENDFKIMSGMYIHEPIHQMDAVREERKIVTSQTGKIGLQMYSFEVDDESGRKQELLATSGLSTPNFAVLQEEKKLVCSQCNHKPLTLYDVSSEQIVRELKHPLLINEKISEDICDCCNLKCQALDSNTLAVLDANTGEIVLIDLRAEHAIPKLTESVCGEKKESWTLSKFDYKIFAHHFGKLSTKGSLHLYDIRNFSSYLITECFNSTVSNCNVLKLKMGDGERFSVSGLDSNVYVYKISRDNPELVFTHDGHCPSVCDKSKYPINDHIWLPSVGDNFIVSVCENKTLNCWEYNA